MGILFNIEQQKSVRQQLRNRMTHAEKILWYYLRKENMGGYKFRRQYGIGPYVVDFYCPLAKLAIELDGDSHYRGDAGRRDPIRQHDIEGLGIRVLRFTDHDIRESLPAVIEKIEKSLTPSNSPFKRGRNGRTPSNLPAGQAGSPLKRGRNEKSISSP